jgi:hypothetical protein
VIPLQCRACIFLLFMPCALLRRLSLIALSKFLDFSEILENNLMGNRQNKSAKAEELGSCVPLILSLLLRT